MCLTASRQVLVCCDSLPLYHPPQSAATPDGLRYHRLPLADSLAQGLGAYLPSALAFIARGALAGGATLVHCNAGVSRSGAVVVAWLQHAAGLTLHDAYAAARAARPIVTPNSNFLLQLADEEGQGRDEG